LEYLDEVTLAALEQAAMLANHRGSNIVEEEDVQLILGESCKQFSWFKFDY
jgi:histone H3/H4